MASTLKLGKGNWGVKEDSLLAYSDQNNNFIPLPFDFSRASSATVVNKAGLVEPVASGLPRIDFSDDTNGVLLLEPQSTNLVPFSEDFSQWVPSGGLTIGNSSSVVNPSNSNNVGVITGTTGTVSKFARINVATTLLNHTYSAFFKYNTQQFVQFASGGTAEYVNFDIQNGTVGNKSNNATSTIENFGNGWYRCTLSTSVASQPSNMAVVLIDSLTSLRLSPTSSTNSFYIWGAQLEQQSYATSYIPTAGAAATRVQDLCTGAGSASTFNSTEGVLYVEVAALADDLTNRGISISDGTSTSRITFLLSSQSNTLRVFGVEGGLQFNLQNSSFNTLNYNKIAVLYQLNNFKLFINGTQIGSSTSGAVPIGLNSIVFDNGSGGLNFYGKTKQVIAFPTALSDAELEALTTI